MSKKCTLNHLQAGVGLIDILIGLFISSLVLITVYASLVFFDASKRTAVSGNSAFANAISGLYLIGYDVKNAGLGLMANRSIYCGQFNIYYNGTVKANNTVIPPIAIEEGVDNPDKITILYGESIYSGAPAKIISNMSSPSAPVTVNASTKEFVSNQVLLASAEPNQPCTLIAATGLNDNGNSSEILHTHASPYNPADPTTVFTNALTYQNGGYVINVQKLRWLTWQVNNGVLEVVDRLTGTTEVVADNIIELQAQYGIADANSTTITQWVNASDSDWQNLNKARMARIRAVRIAIIARSPQKEKPSVSGAACDATTVAPLPWPGGDRVDISENPDWRCYRYLVLKTVFQLNNIVWGQSS
ncbi:MAG: pilW [Gammaproteobacteria bacterium]|nr:pilW [Gammaproteobacteria bacterium]